MTKEILIPVLIFGLLVIIGFIVLNVVQKKNRQYEKKGVLWYLVISLLVFFILGLTALMSGKLAGIQVVQVVAFAFGVFHVWFVFSNYDWANRKAFLSETLLTLTISTIAGLGYVIGLWFWPWLFDEQPSFASAVYTLVLLIPLPYLFVRTYDCMLQIPQKEFIAWVFPKTAKPNLNFNERNVIYVYLNLFTKSSSHIAGKISNRRSRLPKDAGFGDFFQHFVKDYNEDKHTSYPISNLNQDINKQSIGWVFYRRRTEKGRKVLIDPYVKAIDQLQEGDFVFASRVLLGKSYNELDALLNINPRRNALSDDEDSIIITEK